MKIIKDKKGGLFIGFIFAMFFFMIGMWMLPFIQDQVSDARTDINCSSTAISDGNKLTCLVVDIGIPYFIIAILVFISGLIGRNL